MTVPELFSDCASFVSAPGLVRSLPHKLGQTPMRSIFPNHIINWPMAEWTALWAPQQGHAPTVRTAPCHGCRRGTGRCPTLTGQTPAGDLLRALRRHGPAPGPCPMPPHPAATQGWHCFRGKRTKTLFVSSHVFLASTNRLFMVSNFVCVFFLCLCVCVFFLCLGFHYSLFRIFLSAWKRETGKASFN